MGVPGNANALLLRSAAAAGGYQVSRSLRFNSSDSAYLSRTPASAGNRKTWTWSGWAKRSSTVNSKLFYTQTGSAQGGIQWESTAQISYFNYAGNYSIVKTTGVFRDFSAWYHIVVTLDAANTSLKIYVNGVEQALTVSAAIVNENHTINSTVEHNIGKEPTASEYFNGYLAEIHFIDGQALTPSSFAETDATTGQWIPKAYTGSYGTNGFRLSFSDNSGTTSTTLGKDAAGSNNWTPNNFSVASGSGNDSLVDTPTSYGTDTGVGGEVRGNYATLNPLDNDGNTLINGNLEITGTGNTFKYTRSTIYVSADKWYWECLISAAGGQTRTGPQILRASDTLGAHSTGNIRGYIYISDYSGAIYVSSNPNGSNTTLYSTAGNLAAGTIVGIALDATNGKLWVSVNGTWLNSGNPDTDSNPVATGLTGPYTPGGWAFNSSDLLVYNFGQRAFSYTSNHATFKALCDTNLPSPLVAKPNTVMDVALYSGNSSTQSISGYSLSPDLVWIKTRSQANNNFLFDSVRGVGNWLISDLTNAEGYTANTLTSFNSDGFTTGSNNDTNASGRTFVAWMWDAGSSTVTNTQGSITSQVRANVSAGFSVATLTTPASGNFTVGHGLNVAPSLVICKARNQSYTWLVYHKSTGAGNYLVLNTTAASSANSTVWQNTDPSSTLVYGNAGNWGTADYVMYCFAPVAGYSSAFSYSGNGSSDGSFVYLGFRPKLVLIKRSDSSENWYLWDTMRDTYNLAGKNLLPNLSNAEPSIGGAFSATLDILSNGFKLRDAGAGTNASGGTYIGFAWAENPFAYARAR